MRLLNDQHRQSFTLTQLKCMHLASGRAEGAGETQFISELNARQCLCCEIQIDSKEMGNRAVTRPLAPEEGFSPYTASQNRLMSHVFVRQRIASAVAPEISSDAV